MEKELIGAYFILGAFAVAGFASVFLYVRQVNTPLEFTIKVIFALLFYILGCVFTHAVLTILGSI